MSPTKSDKKSSKSSESSTGSKGSKGSKGGGKATKSKSSKSSSTKKSSKVTKSQSSKAAKKDMKDDKKTSSVSDFVKKPETVNSKQKTENSSKKEEKNEAKPSSSATRKVVRRVKRRVVKPVKKAKGQTENINGRTVWRSASVVSADDFGGEVDGRVIPDAGMPTETITGVLDMNRDGNGVLRTNYSFGNKDAYISGTQIRRFYLRPGDVVEGPARAPKESEQYWGLLKVEKINGKKPEDVQKRVKFSQLTPVYPDKKITLETEKDILSTRLIDLVAPIGLGQRGMIVSSPKAGKTTILKDIATGIAKNYKDVFLMAVLIGERPEEVTDIRRHIAAITDGNGEVAASNFDEPADQQAKIAEVALERAKRHVELGNDVVILLDSITRLARAYNLAIPTSGRTLSGGFDPAALYPPKRFFGAARNFEDFDTPDGKKSGSLTILGTALIDTGSKMDDLIYEEFKGTGNMELHLDRSLAERRIYPAIDVQRSGTRREDLLFSQNDYQSVILMRRMNDLLDPKERTSVLVNKMKQTKNNKEFLATLREG